MGPQLFARIIRDKVVKKQGGESRKQGTENRKQAPFSCTDHPLWIAQGHVIGRNEVCSSPLGAGGRVLRIS